MALGHGVFRLRTMGANVSACLNSIWPCLASSSEAAKVAAVAERRRAGPTRRPGSGAHPRLPERPPPAAQVDRAADALSVEVPGVPLRLLIG